MLRAAMPNFSLGITRGLQMAQVKRPASALTRPLGLVYFHVKDGTVRTPQAPQVGGKIAYKQIHPHKITIHVLVDKVDATREGRSPLLSF